VICAVIKGPTWAEAKKQLAKAIESSDLIELRLDFFEDLSGLEEFRGLSLLPLIFTLRSKAHGGLCDLALEERLALISYLASYSPTYLDIELDVPDAFLSKLKEAFPLIKIILSYHNFSETPENLEEIYLLMQKKLAFFYKIAVMAKSSLDAFRLILWAKEKKEKNLIPISMGPCGHISRILGPVIGTPFMYASLEEEEHLLSISQLVNRYHYKRLNHSTALYGLIGDPIEGSISDATHNAFFKEMGMNAVYIKIPLKVLELGAFFKLAKKLAFQGLSVTMPLKEAILPFVDEIDPNALEIGAINTLVLREEGVKGFNTDGVGGLDAIEKCKPVKGLKIAILGYGGVAKAIAYEAHRRGALISIIGRDEEKAKALACHFQGETTLHPYDVLINCTPLLSPLESSDIVRGSLIMDTKTKPKNTPFLDTALEKKCSIIYGYSLFVNQAVGQFAFWFPEKIAQLGKEVAVKFLEKSSLTSLEIEE
jgi:3-dehydroquinate dehydratase/shikimate dehydrogenase